MNVSKSMLMLVITAAAAVSITACGKTAAISSSAPAAKNGSGGTLIIGATFSNIPNMDVYPDQGYEGRRFVGNQLYDPLIAQNPNTNELEPDLAQSYDTSDNKVWTFHLRPNVTFHDGTPWNTSAAVFNLDRLMKTDFKYYYAPVAALLISKTKSIASYKALDDMTLQITLKEPDSFFVSDLTQIYFASPAAIQKYGNEDYQNHPTGTGPFKLDKVLPRQELDLVPNRDYWNHPPKLDKLVLRPMPDPASRLAAVLAGQINWAEVPPTESIDQLKQKGFQVLTKPYPHIWEVIPNMAKPPFNDKRVREAFVEAIDRESMSDKLLNGAAAPANGAMFPESKYYPEDAQKYPYDAENAKKLLKEAGYEGGLNITLNMPTSGSGNMWPLPMSEYIQSQEEKVGIHVKFRTYDWKRNFNAEKDGL
ncbi:ABC transporter substrate-binding protein [Paenibacillus humicola]|uniref:ABC transporter substrate-binding protein n=1 Tax=Paenibacillus humicola TaxID=3110540 RepID=UPI00237A7770|nr:ABC transporter substrate-binding protein [Paenibacillus humicola]